MGETTNRPPAVSVCDLLMENACYSGDSDSPEIVIGDNVDSVSASSSVASSSSPVCRICIQGHVEPGNPLISPCRCSGSIGFVHRKCLRVEIESI